MCFPGSGIDIMGKLFGKHATTAMISPALALYQNAHDSHDAPPASTAVLSPAGLMPDVPSMNGGGSSLANTITNDMLKRSKNRVVG